MKDVGAKAKISLWLLTVPVAAWALHFLAVYVIAAIYCAKADTPGTAGSPLTTVRWAVVAVTLATLVVYAIAARRGYAGLRRDSESVDPDPHDQNRFLGQVALMLCTLSAAATLFLASVPFFFGDCRP